MRFEFLDEYKAARLCNDIVKLNYGIHLELGDPPKTEYLCLVGENNTVLSFLGFCVSPMDDKYVEVFSLNTHPDYRNRGYATTLLSEIYSHFCTMQEDVRILLTCDKTMADFYVKREYKLLSCTKDTCILLRTNG